MPTDDSAEQRLLVKALAWYLHRGYRLEVHEPPVRGRKGPAHDSVRHVGVRILNPRAFDSIRWELLKKGLRGGSS